MSVVNRGPFDFVMMGESTADAEPLTLSFQAWGDSRSTETCLVVVKGQDDVADVLLSLDDMRDLHDAIGRHIGARAGRVAP